MTNAACARCGTRWWLVPQGAEGEPPYVCEVCRSEGKPEADRIAIEADGWLSTGDGILHPPRKWASEEGPLLHVDSYAFGRIDVSGREFRRDVILFRRRLYPSWWRAVGHELCVADLEKVGAPPLLIVGTGASGRMQVLPEVQRWSEREGVRLVVEMTSDACRAFNKAVRSEDAVAALHLTC